MKFYFQGCSFRQTVRVAMGSSLDPTLADIFMAKLGSSIDNVIEQIPLYKRYLDDILRISKSKEQIENILSIFNTIHPNILFTSEFEKHEKLSFLDMLIRRNADGTMSRSVYRKPIGTGQYLNFNSFSPVQHKRALVRTLAHRARQICTADLLDEEMEQLKSSLRANNYPDRFIDKHVTVRQRSKMQTTVPKKPVHIEVPFTGDYAFNLFKSRLNVAIRRTYNAAELNARVYTRSMPLPPIKVRNSVLSTSHCIYEFTCSCGDTYIGRTDRRLETRAKEHVPKRVLSFLTNPSANLNEPKVNSSIARHLIRTRHSIDIYSSFKVLTANTKLRRLKFLEAILISRNKPELCSQKDLSVTLKLPWFY